MANIKQLEPLSSRKSSLAEENHISELMDRIERISESVQVDFKKNSLLNVIEFEHEKSSFDNDPYTRLRNLQNKSQLNRAQLELLSQRKPKHYSFNSRDRYKSNEKHVSYLDIFKVFKSITPFKERRETEMVSEDENNETAVLPEGVSNIKHYNLLKHHPKILEFTYEKIKEKKMQETAKQQKEQQIEAIKQSSQLSSLRNSRYRDIIDEKRKKSVVNQDANVIVDNQLSKFYSKSSKGKLDLKIKQNERCSRMLQKQDKLVTNLENENVSKEYVKKLKEKLNEIVNEIGRSDKKRSQQKLPRLIK